MITPSRDRYVTFEGLDCDRNATRLMAIVRQHIGDPAKAGQWGRYFSSKLVEQQRLGVDDLFFVGSQMNNLFAFFEECGDEASAELLYQVEQECC
jgi:hypothetical protein